MVLVCTVDSSIRSEILVLGRGCLWLQAAARKSGTCGPDPTLLLMRASPRHPQDDARSRQLPQIRCVVEEITIMLFISISMATAATISAILLFDCCILLALVTAIAGVTNTIVIITIIE